jgi:hypothetical protein
MDRASTAAEIKDFFKVYSPMVDFLKNHLLNYARTI